MKIVLSVIDAATTATRNSVPAALNATRNTIPPNVEARRLHAKGVA